MKLPLKVSAKKILFLALYVGMLYGFILSECTMSAYHKSQELSSRCHNDQAYLSLPDALRTALKNILQTFIEHHISPEAVDEMPEEFFSCYQTLQQGESLFLPDVLLKTLSSIVLKLEPFTPCKAPREDAPDSNFIVGPLITCDISSVIVLVNQIITLINNCCNQLEQDFTITFSLITDFNNTLTTCIQVITALDFSRNCKGTC